MASKKTGDESTASDTATPEAETVGVTDAETRGDAPETVDAEIVDEREDRDEPGAASTGTADGPADRSHGDGEPKKKGGGGGFVVGLLVLAAVLAALFFVFQDDILGTDDPAQAETTPGVVVSDAAPFPGNELDDDVRRPVTGEAAPGTREAAQTADAEREAEDAAPVTSLRARAMEQARVRREAREAERDVDAVTRQVEERADDEDARPRTGFVSEDGESEMAAAVRRARAEQARIRREDRERSTAGEQDDAGTPPVAAAVPTPGEDDPDTGEASQDEAEQSRDARIAALRARREREAAAGDEARDDDPNALSGFTTQEDDADEAAETLRERMALRGDDDPAADSQTTDDQATDDQPTETTRPARPTGRIRPISPAASEEDGQDDDPNVLAAQERPRPVRPRPPVVRDAPNAVPSSVTTDEAFEERFDAAEADLRDTLRQDLTAEVREDVLAEASQRIDQAIRQTEQEVAQLRTQLGEQEARSDQRIAQLRDRLEVLQDRDASANTRGVLILALSNLRGQLDAGAPFERQLDDVERVAPNVTTLRDARRFARTGLPTDADLRERFRAAEREALRLEAGEDADGFFSGMWANVKGLFTVREIGEVEGEDTEAVISRARAALVRGEVGAAVQEIDQLDGVAAEAFEPFVEEARAKSATKLQIQWLERAVLDQPERG